MNRKGLFVIVLSALVCAWFSSHGFSLASAGEGDDRYVPHGAAPSASTVYRVDDGKISIAGYGEAVTQGFDRKKQNGDPSGKKNAADLLRFVLYTGYRFTDKILLNSEIEFEHAKSEDNRGAVEVEFADLDFLISRPFSVRAGLMLMPMGFINEMHEPTVFYGALRPDIETNILPTTWRENGVGFFGDIGPFAYRTYLISGLQAAPAAGAPIDGFNASSGIRGGRSDGSKSLAEDVAWVGRLDLVSIPGFLFVASAYTGKSGHRITDPASGAEINGHVTLWDVHSEWGYRGLKLRGLYARGSIGDVAKINNANGLAGNQSVGEHLWGGYVEGAYDWLPLVCPDTRQSLAYFMRYERYNTQDGVPHGFTENPANSRSVLTYGLDYKPIEKVVVKADYQVRHDKAGTGVDQFNLALGWRF